MNSTVVADHASRRPRMLVGGLWLLALTLAAPVSAQPLPSPNFRLAPPHVRSPGGLGLGTDPTSGTSLVVWFDILSGHNSTQITGQLFTPSGPLGTPFVVASNVLPLTLAFNSIDREYFVAYTRSGEAFGRRLSHDGTLVGMEIEIANDVTEFAIAHNAAANEYLVVWAIHVGAPGGGSIVGQRLDASGAKIGSVQTLATRGGLPAVAFNARTSQYLVAWSDDPSGFDSVDVLARVVNGDGSLANAPFVVTTTEGGLLSRVAVAANHVMGGYLVVWRDTRFSPDGDIFARLLSSDGSARGEEITISTFGLVEDEPSVTYHAPSDRYLVAWSAAPHSLDRTISQHGYVFGRLLTGDGALEGPAFAISGDAGHDPVVANGAGNIAFLTVWRDNRQSPLGLADFATEEIFGQALPSGFVPQASALEVFVVDLYRELLGRVPSAAETSSWMAFLRANPTTAGVSAMLHTFVQSPEANLSLTPAAWVVKFYRTVLGRPPDPMGQAAVESLVVAQLNSIVPGIVASASPGSFGSSDVDVILERWYRIILGRAADEQEIIAWSRYLESTGDFSGAARAFFSSAEYLARSQTFADHAVRLYQALFSRDPLPAERQALLGALLDRFRTVLPGFFGSPEFQRLVSGLTDPVAVDTLVRRFYGQLLGRAPADAEVTLWVSHLLATHDAASLVNGFFLSPEYHSVPRSLADHVRLLYRTVLGREPAAAEVALWVNFIAARLGEVIPSLFASPEVQFQYATRIASVYIELLSREATAAEVATWAAYLAATGDVRGMLTAFLTSPEYVAMARRPSQHVTGVLFAALGPSRALPEPAPLAALKANLAGVADVLIGSPEFAGRLRLLLP